MFLLSLFSFSVALGTYRETLEKKPTLYWQNCDIDGVCSKVSTKITLDANFRNSYNFNGIPCYSGNNWNHEICPNPQDCSDRCFLDNADYNVEHGIIANGSSLRLNYVNHGPSTTYIGSRVFLLENETHYQRFFLKNRQFSFTVDSSNLPCGLVGALHLVLMKPDGGLSSLNHAGASYGTGYCNAQCPHNILFVDGLGNVEDWNPSEDDPLSGNGKLGSCCPEVDLWEANSRATALTIHNCYDDNNQVTCNNPVQCGDGSHRNSDDAFCDKNGCDYNPYRYGNKTFYGPGLTIDTRRPFTVITKFITNNGQDHGRLIEIRRKYVQDGVSFDNPFVNIPDFSNEYNSLTDEFCSNIKTRLNEPDTFSERSGLKGIQEALESGMVLALSLLDDHAVHNLWLDSIFPTDASPDTPGAERGPCPITSGNPEEVATTQPDSFVAFSNFKVSHIEKD